MMNLEVKDALYYSDLICELKSLAGFEQIEDIETLKRIIKRKRTIAVKQESGYSHRDSSFMQELIEIIMGISKKAGVRFKTGNEISKYPELVNEVLAILENKKNELTQSLENNKPVLTRKLIPTQNTGNKQD